MSIARKSIDACIGCMNCVNVCPMDVFYPDQASNKSVMTYPENCQSCAQCYLSCPTDSLFLIDTQFEYAPVPMRGLRTFTQLMPVVEESAGSGAGGSRG
jgi:NAD-dependent dihydropyrimidine dehydrogenase PreA subunit